jgi:acetylornithine deacetylase
MEKLISSSINLLRDLIATPSFSGEEQKTAMLIKQWLESYNIPTQSIGNTIWAKNLHFDSKKPTLLLGIPISNLCSLLCF